MTFLFLFMILAMVIFAGRKAFADTRPVNDAGNFTIGASTIYVGAYGDTKDAAREVGMTQGGVSWNYTRNKFEKRSDQKLGVLGTHTIDDRLEISFTMKENTLENLALAWDLPDSAVDEATNTLSIGRENGNAIERCLFIDGPAPGGGTASWEFWKVDSYSSEAIGQTKEGEALLQVTMLVIEDTTKPAIQRYGRRADTYDDTTAPQISSVTPNDGAAAVAVDSNIEWTFSEPIMEIDITSGNFNVTDDAGNEVAGTLAYDRGTNKVTFNPTNNLAALTTYLTFVSGEVRDLAGNKLGANSRTTFTTA